MDYTLCRVWTVARTSLGTAVLLRTEEEDISFPVYLTTGEAHRLLNALEGAVGGDLIDLFLQRESLSEKKEPAVYLLSSEENLKGELRMDRETFPLKVVEAIELTLRGEIPLYIDRRLFKKRAIRVNLLQKEESSRLERLEEQLNEAVQMEYYEDAAIIRDEIYKLDPSRHGAPKEPKELKSEEH